MLKKELEESYIRILQRELVPALGCTEPIALAYAAAKACKVLGQFPEKMIVYCSGNVIKNVKAVTVPNSGGMRGVDAACVLGAVGRQRVRGFRGYHRGRHKKDRGAVKNRFH